LAANSSPFLFIRFQTIFHWEITFSTGNQSN
jgi:hypothetical protein